MRSLQSHASTVKEGLRDATQIFSCFRTWERVIPSKFRIGFICITSNDATETGTEKMRLRVRATSEQARQTRFMLPLLKTINGPRTHTVILTNWGCHVVNGLKDYTEDISPSVVGTTYNHTSFSQLSPIHPQLQKLSKPPQSPGKVAYRRVS